MGIILKFILNNIMEKKLRTLLILVAIIISTALFFASTTLPGTVAEIFMSTMTKSIGNSDIVVTAGEDSYSPFFKKVDGLSDNPSWEYSIYSVDSMALHRGSEFQLANVKLLGMDHRDVQTFNPFAYYSGNPTSLKDNDIIIGRDFSERHGLDLSSTLELEIYGGLYKFNVVGIAEPTGPFMEDGSMNQFIVHPQIIREIYGLTNNYVSTVYIKSNTDDLGAEVSSLINIYTDLNVTESIPKDDIEFHVNTLKMPFNITLGLVFFVSFFIIYTSFKLIMRERLPITGTFRSIGATKASTSMVLMGETIVYAIIGGSIGVFLGIGILSLISRMLTGLGNQSEIPKMYSAFNVLMSFLTAFLITLLSGISPILSSTKYSIKEIILNTMEKPKSKKAYKLVLGIVFVLFAVVGPNLADKHSIMLITISAMLLTIVAIVFLAPYATKFLIILFEKVYYVIFGNIGILACKNIRDNKSIVGSVTLISIGIATLLSINTVTYSVMKEVAMLYSSYGDYATYMRATRLNDDVLQKIKEMDGVENATGVMDSFLTDVVGHETKLTYLQAIKPEYVDYWRMKIAPEDLEQLQKGNMIVTSKMADLYDLKKGDTLTLRDNGKTLDFKVVGMFDSLSNNGDFVLITIEDYKDLFGAEFYSSIYIKGGDADAIARSVREEFYHLNPFVRTLAEQEKMNHDNNAQIFGILTAFSLLAMISGLLGIVNNLIISFIERKRSLAMYRSLGMSKTQIRNMVLIESFTGGLAGGVLGLLGGLLLILNMPHLTKAMVAYIPMHYQVGMFVNYLIAGVVVMVLASLSPALKSSKLNIIEAIKFE